MAPKLFSWENGAFKNVSFHSSGNWRKKWGEGWRKRGVHEGKMVQKNYPSKKKVMETRTITHFLRELLKFHFPIFPNISASPSPPRLSNFIESHLHLQWMVNLIMRHFHVIEFSFVLIDVSFIVGVKRFKNFINFFFFKFIIWEWIIESNAFLYIIKAHLINHK